MTPQETFDLLAEAAQVRHPNPNRDNRGLCPAHGDQHNPALVFKIGDTGNLVAYCHSQHCTIEALARSIGVSTSSFFKGTSGSRFATHVPIVWAELPILDLLKLVPFGYDFDTQVECVMRTLDVGLEYSEQPLSVMTKTELLTLGGIWIEPGYDHNTHGDWWDHYHRLLSAIHDINNDTRIDEAAPVSAIPRGA
jgi:hypothetical protein